MRKIEKEVTSGKKTIGKIQIDQADSAAECIKLAGDEKRMVELFNRMVVTDAMNAARRPVADVCVSMLKKTPVGPKGYKIHEALIKAFEDGGLDTSAAKAWLAEEKQKAAAGKAATN